MLKLAVIIKYLKVAWYCTLSIIFGYSLYTATQVGQAWVCMLLMIGGAWAAIVTTFD